MVILYGLAHLAITSISSLNSSRTFAGSISSGWSVLLPFFRISHSFFICLASLLRGNAPFARSRLVSLSGLWSDTEIRRRQANNRVLDGRRISIDPEAFLG